MDRTLTTNYAFLSYAVGQVFSDRGVVHLEKILRNMIETKYIFNKWRMASKYSIDQKNWRILGLPAQKFPIEASSYDR